MNYLQSIIISVIEGLTEFLPISSTGHMILASEIMKISQSEFVKSFEIIIQLGAILAVVVLYWRRFLEGIRIWKVLLAAFLPAGILGFVLYKLIKHYLLGNVYVVLSALFIGGIVFIILEKYYSSKELRIGEIKDLSLKNAFIIGLFQSVSMIPGVSRAASTIFGGLIVGLDRKSAVEFSFLLAVPTMMAATALDLVKSNFHFSVSEISILLVGFIGAFVTALFAVKFFLEYIKKHNFIPFGIYRIIISIVFWIITTH
jgi:undecaprenyl-diphosphatase